MAFPGVLGLRQIAGADRRYLAQIVEADRSTLRFLVVSRDGHLIDVGADQLVPPQLTKVEHLAVMASARGGEKGVVWFRERVYPVAVAFTAHALHRIVEALIPEKFVHVQDRALYATQLIDAGPEGFEALMATAVDRQHMKCALENYTAVAAAKAMYAMHTSAL